MEITVVLLTRALSPGPASIIHFKTMPGLLRDPAC
jgi:hypothetical protein